MRKQESNQVLEKKQRIISALLQDMVKWSEKEKIEKVTKSVNRSIQIKEQDSVSFEFGNLSIGIFNNIALKVEANLSSDI